jgi:hypothetical protein
MSRVITGVLTATAMLTAAAGAASAGGCFGGFGCGGCCAAPAYQPVPVPVAVPVPVPPVRYYVVNQGPVIAGPGLTDFGPWIYHVPQPAGRFPYVGGGRQWHAYYHPAYGSTPRWRDHPRYYGNPVPVPAGEGNEPVLVYR